MTADASQKTNRARIAAIALGAGLALAGCGGGGGSSSPPPQNLSSANVATALNAYYQANQGFQLSASSAGNTFSVDYSETPVNGTTTFNGVNNVSSTNVSVSVYENGTLLGTQISTDYFTINPYVFLGSVLSNGTQYGVVTSWTPPSTVNVGDSGPLYGETIYHDSTKATIDGTETTTYAVNAATPTTLQFCENVSISANANSDGLVSGTGSACFYVSSSGSVTGITLTITVNGTTLIFQ